MIFDEDVVVSNAVVWFVVVVVVVKVANEHGEVDRGGEEEDGVLETVIVEFIELHPPDSSAPVAAKSSRCR